MWRNRLWHTTTHIHKWYSTSVNNNSTFISPDRAIKIMKQTNAIEQDTLAPINSKLLGPLERRGGNDERLTSLPFVFLLGNHSSGKSSFINHVLKRQVQDTGVAPTDDGFTIISPGDQDLDQDGPALVGDPDMGFAGLRSFGPALIQRTRLKVRENVGINFMLVDSPGMIDSPTSHVLSQKEMQDAYLGKKIVGQADLSDRGYDFRKVSRWFAERADVILLFFDPDKPGTTGETLSILTSSLLGMDHKLHIILNKVDQFKKIHDFARAYGSLCWNLSKVIPRKDLPRIYTMCIPLAERQQKLEGGVQDTIATALSELDSTRDEVVNEVLRAPERRVDNVITRLYDSTRLLQMHVLIIEAVRGTYRRELWNRRITVGVSGIGGSALVASAVYCGLPIEFTALATLMSVVVTGGLQWQASNAMTELQKVRALFPIPLET